VGDNKPKEFRLYPRKPRSRQASSPRTWCSTYILLLRYARQLRARRHKPRSRREVPSRPYNQRCAVRVMYTKNATRGQWKAHGRYIARESATQGSVVEAGFDATERGINIAARLDQWQAAGDERLWKLILSPELGEKIDLVQLTRDLMKRITRDLDTHLEWVAVSHFNTDNPHVHIALRGVREDGKSLRLERDYVKHGIRSIAEDFCTRQLGYRTQLDIAQAQHREVSQQRFTSLDRAIARDKPTDGQSSHFPVTRNPAQPKNQYVIARLKTLEGMGLAEADGPDQWLVREDFVTALRAMQRLGDRQKLLAAHGVPASDTQLPLVMFDLRNCTTLEGRILVHGEDEGTGRSFMMLEGTDAKVHCIYHTPRMAEARGRGGLRTNRFVRLRKLFENGQPMLEIDELGHSKKILSNRHHHEETARKLMQSGTAPVEDGWGGWLGRYQRALCQAAIELEDVRKPTRERDHSRER
jgi:type IV secretory pathway VirD2 relaxase